MALERRCDVDLVGRISGEHAVLSNQAAATLSKEHLVAELDGFQHRAPFDQIRMGFENRRELFLGGHVLPAGRVGGPD